jgi:hypothetical protein
MFSGGCCSLPLPQRRSPCPGFKRRRANLIAPARVAFYFLAIGPQPQQLLGILHDCMSSRPGGVSQTPPFSRRSTRTPSAVSSWAMRCETAGCVC